MILFMYVWGGRLREHISSLEALQLPEYVLKILRQGYILPFTSLPKPVILGNNKSALENESFVTEAITDLLACQSIATVNRPLLIVNPLSVVTKSRGKNRLVLDLRHINPHLHKFKFKCADVDTAVLFLNPGDFLFTFDIKSAYHHIEIFQDHQTYFGLQWGYTNGKPQYFVFRVPPFGLSTAPLVFTKILKPVLRHWRSSGKRVCMFLDDGT